MHRSAMRRMEWFVENYIPKDQAVKVLDVGSYDENGAYRSLFAGLNVEYTGLDVSQGPNVDYVPEDPYEWDGLEDESFDFIISGNAFEHIEYPWLTIREIYKKVKKGGFVCVLAPNSIPEHRYPVDCYRYFSDGFRALAKWGGFQVVDVTVSGIPRKDVDAEWYEDGFNDTMMVLTKQCDDVDISKLPHLQYEKRDRCAIEWKRRYFLLLDWICTEDRTFQLRRFFEREGMNKVVLYGYGTIGKLLYNELKKVTGIKLYVMDLKGGNVDGCDILTPGKAIDESQDTCIINAVLDIGMQEALNELYPNIKVYMAGEVFKS